LALGNFMLPDVSTVHVACTPATDWLIRADTMAGTLRVAPFRTRGERNIGSPSASFAASLCGGAHSGADQRKY
jgi:hypothetical protein